jgi:hypothetical protein
VYFKTHARHQLSVYLSVSARPVVNLPLAFSTVCLSVCLRSSGHPPTSTLSTVLNPSACRSICTPVAWQTSIASLPHSLTSYASSSSADAGAPLPSAAAAARLCVAAATAAACESTCACSRLRCSTGSLNSEKALASSRPVSRRQKQRRQICAAPPNQPAASCRCRARRSFSILSIINKSYLSLTIHVFLVFITSNTCI